MLTNEIGKRNNEIVDDGSQGSATEDESGQEQIWAHIVGDIHAEEERE